MHCPICAQPLQNGELLMVCQTCHKGLGGAGGLSVHSTGEFRVPTPEMVAAVADAAAQGSGAAGERPKATNVCSWCGKLERDVKKLLGRGGTALCNECVALASDILDAELGGGWR